MSHLINSILDLPKTEQLGYALDIIRDLTHAHSTDIYHYRARYGLRQKQAEVLHALVSNAGKTTTREALMTALYEYETDVWEGVLYVYICQIRKKLKGIARIMTVHSVGYTISEDDAARLAPLSYRESCACRGRVY